MVVLRSGLLPLSGGGDRSAVRPVRTRRLWRDGCGSQRRDDRHRPEVEAPAGSRDGNWHARRAGPRGVLGAGGDCRGRP